MSVSDPVADLLTRIRNAHQAYHENVEVPFSKMNESIIRILQEEGYVQGHKVNEKSPFSTISVALKYVGDREPAIRRIQRVSKPGRRVYTGKDEIPSVLGGLGINIISTSRGLLTGKAAREIGVGGEVLCEVY